MTGKHFRNWPDLTMEGSKIQTVNLSFEKRATEGNISPSSAILAFRSYCNHGQRGPGHFSSQWQILNKDPSGVDFIDMWNAGFMGS